VPLRRCTLVRAAALLGLAAAAGCAHGGERTIAPVTDRYVTVYEQLHPAVVLLTMKIHANDPKRKGQWDDAYGSGVAIVDVALRNQRVAKLGSVAHIEPGTAIGVLGYPIPDAFDDEHLGRTVSLYTGRVASVRKGALEIDVPIIPGESGGPVFDVANGEVIGIAESRFDEERAIGFATPIDAATRFLAAHPRTQTARR